VHLYVFLEIQGVAMSDDQETPQELEMKVLSVLQHVDESINKDDILMSCID